MGQDTIEYYHEVILGLEPRTPPDGRKRHICMTLMLNMHEDAVLRAKREGRTPPTYDEWRESMKASEE